MKITKRQLKRIIKEEISRGLLLREGGDPYDLLYTKYDKVADAYSSTDSANALADDLGKAGLWEKIPGYEQDLDWDEQLTWVANNLTDQLDALLQAATDNPKYGIGPGGVGEEEEEEEYVLDKGEMDQQEYAIRVAVDNYNKSVRDIIGGEASPSKYRTLEELGRYGMQRLIEEAMYDTRDHRDAQAERYRSARAQGKGVGHPPPAMKGTANLIYKEAMADLADVGNNPDDAEVHAYIEVLRWFNKFRRKKFTAAEKKAFSTNFNVEGTMDFSDDHGRD